MRIEQVGQATLINADCREAMALLDENSVDSIVTDPPYGLGFMGKGWDHGVPSTEFWLAALRVAKPGAYLLAFGGTRTFHRLACAIEDAGWELRDTIMWVYGSGFPKSLDVSKAIDKAAGAEREVVGSRISRQPTGNAFAQDAWTKEHGVPQEIDITLAATAAAAAAAAKQWQGWGTALKPAWEPIIVARKPLVGTVAENVQQFGTGVINVDGCRVGSETVTTHSRGSNGAFPKRPGETTAEESGRVQDQRAGLDTETERAGRWPANLIHDGSAEVLECFPGAGGQLADAKQSGERKFGNVYSSMRYGEPSANSENAGAVGFKMKPGARRLDSGSAARFFYCAKASKADRDEGMEAAPDKVLAMSNQAKAEQARGNLHDADSGMNSGKIRKNNHPTVKPTALMRYLVRLVTQPNGVVLDPFMGSGSTGKAARLEGFQFIGIDSDTEHGYFEIALARV